MFLKLIYDVLASTFPSEPESISFFALSIIIATIILKAVMVPVTISQLRNQKKMAELQPELEKLQKKYKYDEKTLMVKQQQLYKDANYNMLSGCLPMIVQLVILMAFYRVFWEPAKYAFTDAKAFAEMSKNFFFIQNLEEIDSSMILGVIAALTTFLTSFVSNLNPANKAMQNQQSQSMMTSMMVVMPIMIFIMARKMQAALVLYWTISNLFAIVQQLISNFIVAKNMGEVK
ncbi:YidC/Oxa1 family membrane protein insertase [Anaerosphaera multitolerans]|uniref:YidC/Oxa1 family membrane protein insertase n=2 Tax=Anaerosphaera multitolerans TaxID=2487351 RepID=A0A437SAJ6_9FIRM|nr:YidC/Oxa1 family membrane protein insertase [Anaerosphaera multitolerans]